MSKREFMSGYKTYDVEAQGYGSSRQWRSAFKQRMSREEAREILNDDSPLSVLELTTGATWNEIKRAYRRLALRFHPDHAQTKGITNANATERMKQLNAAYVLLEQQYGKV